MKSKIILFTKWFLLAAVLQSAAIFVTMVLWQPSSSDSLVAPSDSTVYNIPIISSDSTVLVYGTTDGNSPNLFLLLSIDSGNAVVNITALPEDLTGSYIGTTDTITSWHNVMSYASVKTAVNSALGTDIDKAMYLDATAFAQLIDFIKLPALDFDTGITYTDESGTLRYTINEGSINMTTNQFLSLLTYLASDEDYELIANLFSQIISAKGYDILLEQRDELASLIIEIAQTDFKYSEISSTNSTLLAVLSGEDEVTRPLSFKYTADDFGYNIYDKEDFLQYFQTLEAIILNIKEQLTKKAEDLGLWDIGFVDLESPVQGLPSAISIVMRLSDKIVDEIDIMPTHQYFHHYRTLNAFLDSCTLQLGNLLAKNGYLYLPIASSQSINGYQGLYSHKKIACFCGLGTIGKSDLFLHKEFGPRVRIATILTDCHFDSPEVKPEYLCGDCMICSTHCPALAITGQKWEGEPSRDILFDPAACSSHMKKEFKMIGRGAVCGICMAKCPQYTPTNK